MRAAAAILLGALLLAIPAATAPLAREQPASPYAAFLPSRGDTHMHSPYSSGTEPISALAAVAQQRNLSWIVITDHASAPPPGECEAEDTPTFLCLRGQEITESGGHVTALGIVTNLTTPSGGFTMGDAMEQGYQQGGLAFVAHPFVEPAAGIPYSYFGTHENYTGLEIYHGWAGWNDNPITTQMDELALQKWDALLNSGRRVVGIGASDSHNASHSWDQGDLFTRRGAVGYPQTRAYLREFSQRGILEALGRGRVLVTDGPDLEFDVAGAIPGDDLRVAAGTSLAVNFTGAANVSSTVRLIVNASEVFSQAVAAGPFSLSTTYTANGDSWVRAEVRSYNSNLFKGETYLAFANPVYVDVPPFDDPPSPPQNLRARLEGNDVVLVWDPSPSADVAYYAVYRAGTPASFDFTYRHARAYNAEWRDSAAAVDGQDHYYVVRAVDRMGHEENNTALAAKLTFPVVPGPNLLGVPLELANHSIASALQTVSYTAVRRHDAVSGDWLAYIAGKPSNDLALLPPGSGFWVNATAPGEFVIAGRMLPAVSLSLKAGWNLVTYASPSPRTLAAALAGVPYDRVEAFDATEGTYRLRAVSEAEVLAPGQALWVRTASDATWTLSP